MSAPSGYTALDFVGFTDKGTYSPIVKYMRNDLVHHGGNIMRCKVDDTLNVTPVEGANWELWIGASANLAERTIAPLENNPADVAFGVGRQIIYDDWLWEVIAPIEVGDALIDYAVDPTNANIKKSAPVETQLLAVKAEADATDNMIAPTEANASSSSAAYSVGDQLILNNILYDVIAAIQVGDALTTGTGGNIAFAASLTDQLAAKANSSDLATVATSGSYNDLSNKPTLGTAAAKNSTSAVTSGSTDLVESGAVASEVTTINSALTDKQNQTLATPTTIDNVSRTTVQDALSALTDSNRLVDNLNGTSRTKSLTARQGKVISDALSTIKREGDIGSVNTGAQIDEGRYFWLGETLKRAKSTIAANATFTSSNCESAPYGGLNLLNNYLSRHNLTVTLNTAVVESATVSLRQYGGVAVLTIRNLILKSSISADSTIATLPIQPSIDSFACGKTLDNNDVFMFVTSAGLLISGITGAPAGKQIYATLIFETDSRP